MPLLEFMKQVGKRLSCGDDVFGSCDPGKLIFMVPVSVSHVVSRQPQVANLSAMRGVAPYHFHQSKSPRSPG